MAGAGQDERDPTARRRFVRLAMAGLAIIVAAATAAGFALDWSLDFSASEIEEVVRSWGMWGVAGSIGLMVLHSFVPFPAELVAVANGMVYGPVWGVVITWVGAMLGALLAFGLARALGRPFVERMVARRKWEHIDDWAAVHGGRMVLIARFFPVIAFNLINYAAGLSRVSWWTFFWATGLGILPLTILMVVMGDRMEVLPWWAWALMIVVLLALCYRFRDRLRPPRAVDQPEADPPR